MLNSRLVVIWRVPQAMNLVARKLGCRGLFTWQDAPIVSTLWSRVLTISRLDSGTYLIPNSRPISEDRMNLQPLEDRIVVRSSEAESTTASGLVIPDTAQEKPQQGEVIAVGPGRRSEQSGDIIPVDVAVGDTVVYSKYGGTEITVEGEELLILNARDVLAKMG